MTKKEAGSLGGKRTVQLYGNKHMSEIGKEGQRRFRELYDVMPAEQARWMLVSKATGKIINIW